MGLPTVSAQHQKELAQANEIVRRTAALLRAAHAAGAEFILEHPADRGALASPIFLLRRHAPIWITPDIVALKADTAAFSVSAVCPWGCVPEIHDAVNVAGPHSSTAKTIEFALLAP
eukprot:4889266-Pleurochrysis_carterae.AAC.1